MLNQWTLIGRIGTIETRNGREKSRLYLSVAEDADYFDQTREEWVKRTRWHNLVAWSEIAERITRSYKVGDLVVVEAEAVADPQRSWTGQFSPPESCHSMRSIIFIPQVEAKSQFAESRTSAN